MVSAAYPPDRCGVGDYTAHLAQRLAQRGRVQVAVLTASPHATQVAGGPAILPASGGGVSAAAVARAVRGFRPLVVHFQYPTRRTTSILAPGLVRRVLGVPVVQTWHEHYSECRQTTRANLWGLDALIHVRADLPGRLPRWLSRRLEGVPVRHIPNGRTIPAIALGEAEREREKARLSGGRPIIGFFGFAYPNKGAHLLFEIADPQHHHLLFVGELDGSHAYQRAILERARSAPWQGHCTTTGYVAADEAGRMLALCDAVVFPFPEGVGAWNTSVNAALSSGVLVVATARDAAHGYDAGRNLFLAACGDTGAMRDALGAHLGQRRPAQPHDDWEPMAVEHERLYESFR